MQSLEPCVFCSCERIKAHHRLEYGNLMMCDECWLKHKHTIIEYLIRPIIREEFSGWHEYKKSMLNSRTVGFTYSRYKTIESAYNNGYKDGYINRGDKYNVCRRMTEMIKVCEEEGSLR